MGLYSNGSSSPLSFEGLTSLMPLGLFPFNIFAVGAGDVILDQSRCRLILHCDEYLLPPRDSSKSPSQSGLPVLVVNVADHSSEPVEAISLSWDLCWVPDRGFVRILSGFATTSGYYQYLLANNFKTSHLSNTHLLCNFGTYRISVLYADTEGGSLGRHGLAKFACGRSRLEY